MLQSDEYINSAYTQSVARKYNMTDISSLDITTMLRVHGARTQLHWKIHLKITICVKCSYAILPVYWRMVLGQPANTSSTHLLPTLVNGFNVTLKGAL